MKTPENLATLAEARDEELREARAALKFALHSAQIGDWHLDLIHDTSRRSLRHDQCFGYTEPIPETEWGIEEFIQHIHPEDRARIEQEFRRCLTELEDWRFETRVVWPDGSIHWIAVHGSVYRTEEGKPTQMLGVVMDITQRKHAEQALAASEQRLRALMQALPVGVSFSADATCQHITGNLAMLQQFDAKETDNISASAVDDQAPGRQVVFFQQGQPISDAELPLQRAVKEGREIAPQEFEVLLPSGRRWIVESSGAPIHDCDGTIVGGVAVTIDITARKRNEQALLESEQRFRTIADAAPVLIWMSGTDKLCDYFNQGWLDFVGRPMEKELGHGWTENVHPEDFDHCLSIYSTSFDARLSFEMEYRMRHHSGEYRWIMDRAVPRFTPDGTFEGYIGSCVDIHPQKQAQEALHEANALLTDKAQHLETLVHQRTAKLSESIGELEAFSYSIAHDMRAPLRSLQGFSDILLSDYGSQLDAKGVEFLRRIATSADRMDKLIMDVLSYSRVVREEDSLQSISVEELIHGLLETYPLFTEDKAEILLGGPFPLVLGNEAMLTQIFSNLLGNAVKFVNPGVKPRVHVWAELKGAWVRISVKDNGIGIDPDQHEKIFDIFQRVNKDFDGTGIGLAIVKKAVQRMGGQVGVLSELHHGCTFWFELRPS
jgi:PAS domain S-box-containing protein